jgi:serine protease SohB
VETYLLFLAKSLTVVLLIGGLLILTGLLSRRGRPQSRLKVKDLGERYDDLARALRATVLPKPAVKAALKKEKAQKKERKSGAGAGRPRVFVLDFRGDLRASRVVGLREEVTAILTLATEADEVVVRLENPGGTVNDQGLAASQLLRFRSRGIPLTVCVDTVAASGGYMMACVANRIVAAPFAVVGSIGVVAQVPNFYRLLDRVGVDDELSTSDDYLLAARERADLFEVEFSVPLSRVRQLTAAAQSRFGRRP